MLDKQTHLERNLGEQMFFWEGTVTPLLRRDRLPTNTTTRHHPIHRWFNFIAGFSPEFVNECCDAAQLRRSAEAVLLDPFAGCATAPLVACQQGFHAIGFEPHPIFFRIAKAKLMSKPTLARLKMISRTIAKGMSEPTSIDTLPSAARAFLEKLFAPNPLRCLLGARDALFASSLHDDHLAFLVLSRIVEKSSHSQTDGIYKAPTTRRIETPPEEALAQTMDMVWEDLQGLQDAPDYSRMASLHESSAEDMKVVPNNSVSIVVTSPPYLNNFDYAEMTRMLLYFWGIASSWSEITDRVHSKLVINTTTALKGHKDKQAAYRSLTPASLWSQLDVLVTSLRQERQTRAGKKNMTILYIHISAKYIAYFVNVTAFLSRNAGYM